MPDADDTLITSDKEKLPPEIAALLDVTQPLPLGVSFFEKQFTIADVVKTIAWAVGLGLFGVLCVVFGVVFIVDSLGDRYSSGTIYLPLIFGLVCLLGAWMMISSLKIRWASRQQQLAGRSSRLGTYLTSNELFQASESDYVVIPRNKFLGLDGNNVKYSFQDKDKSFGLPVVVMNTTPEARNAAIEKWATEAEG